MSSVYDDIKKIASSLDLMMGEAFTQYMGDILTECQVVDDYYLSPYYNSNIGARIDAYELDEDTITLFIASSMSSTSLTSFTMRLVLPPAKHASSARF